MKILLILLILTLIIMGKNRQRKKQNQSHLRADIINYISETKEFNRGKRLEAIIDGYCEIFKCSAQYYKSLFTKEELSNIINY